MNRYDIVTGTSASPFDTVPATLIIDSRARDRNKFPDPGNYIIELEKEYRDVTQIELVSACLPNSGYAINQYNNRIYFRSRETNQSVLADYDRIIEIPTGDYEYDDIDDQPTSLLTAINGLLTSDDNFLFRFNSVLQRFTIEPDAGIVVDFYAGMPMNADDVIGISGSVSLSGSRGNTLSVDLPTMPRSFQLYPQRYLTVKIRELERCSGNTKALDGSFAIVPLETSGRNFTLTRDGDTLDNTSYTLYFPEPKRIRKLEISIYDPYGNHYDFNGHDHYMVFQLLSITRPMKYKGCR
jgi:hypothetical protein